MRKVTILVTALLFAVACGSTLPDLEVCELRVGDPVLGPHETIEVPVSVEVCNTGRSASGVFRVSLLYMTGGLGPFTLTFTVPGQASDEYAMTDFPLAPDEAVVFEGTATFPGTMSGTYVRIMAEADTCLSGDTAYCMVEESYEDNNLSGDILLKLR